MNTLVILGSLLLLACAIAALVVAFVRWGVAAMDEAAVDKAVGDWKAGKRTQENEDGNA
jgi:hypothetical protein